jgi:DNA adenine methylase Dam
MIQSPLNYTGGKYKLLPQILPCFPTEIHTFVDLFCGGCNVGVNVVADRHIYNDNMESLIGLYKVMKKTDSGKFIEIVQKTIDEYGLSDVKNYGYEYYKCNSAEGLSSYNRDKYIRLREDVNSSIKHDSEYYIKLYVLIVFAFNNQIRFNRKGDYNLPPGKRDFNEKMKKKLQNFLEVIHKQNNEFFMNDFTSFKTFDLGENDFVYADPPYLITCATYNEQGGWNEEKEYQLLELLDELAGKGVRFALSNVLEAKGKRNDILADWVAKRPKYKMIELNYSYDNANYQRRGRSQKTREVLVVNY